MTKFPARTPRLLVQLAVPSADSDAMLELALDGAALAAQPAWAVFPIIAARDWARNVVASWAAPGDHVMALPFRQEAGRFDVVRMRYRVRDLLFDIAQSKYVISVVARPIKGEIDTAASHILNLPSRVHFTTTEDERGFVIGSREAPTRQWPEWHELLSCWRDGETLGFVAIKVLGGPNPQAITADEKANRYWFGRPKGRSRSH